MVEDHLREIRNAANRALTRAEREDDQGVLDQLEIVARRTLQARMELGAEQLQPVGNFDAEASEHHDMVQEHLGNVFDGIQGDGNEVIEVESEVEDPWREVIGEVDAQESERQLEYPDPDTVNYKCLEELARLGPCTVKELGRRSDLRMTQVESELPRLWSRMMVDRTKPPVGQTTSLYWLREEGEEHLRETGSEVSIRSDWHEMKRAAYGYMRAEGADA